MDEIKFDWDISKAESNLKKHGVSFEEAKTVFYDENAVQFFDDDSSSNEDRFIMLGVSFKLRLLVVCHCERQKGSIIRIISARKATRKETGYYSEA
ncbi:MAG: BrnT family toxin [Candidatus Omnitrophica bacterium]|nr:BrnT family toxin [Candidatus Omnitrophota bacterium]